MASRNFAKQNGIRYYSTGWGTKLTFHMPLSTIGIVIRNNTMLGLLWNNASGVTIRALWISSTVNDNVTSTGDITVSRDATDTTLVTITVPSSSTIEVFVPA